MKFTTGVLALLTHLTRAKIVALEQDATDPFNKFADHEFVVINYHDSSFEAELSKDVFETAYSRYQKLKGAIPGTDTAVGWFSSNIEDRLLRIGDGESPCHVIAHASGYPSLVLDYKKLKSSDEKDVDARADEIADMVVKMTDNWVALIECDEIAKLGDASTE